MYKHLPSPPPMSMGSWHVTANVWHTCDFPVLNSPNTSVMEPVSIPPPSKVSNCLDPVVKQMSSDLLLWNSEAVVNPMGTSLAASWLILSAFASEIPFTVSNAFLGAAEDLLHQEPPHIALGQFERISGGVLFAEILVRADLVVLENMQDRQFPASFLSHSLNINKLVEHSLAERVVNDHIFHESEAENTIVVSGDFRASAHDFLPRGNIGDGEHSDCCENDHGRHRGEIADDLRVHTGHCVWRGQVLVRRIRIDDGNSRVFCQVHVSKSRGHSTELVLVFHVGGHFNIGQLNAFQQVHAVVVLVSSSQINKLSSRAGVVICVQISKPDSGVELLAHGFVTAVSPEGKEAEKKSADHQGEPTSVRDLLHVCNDQAHFQGNKNETEYRWDPPFELINIDHANDHQSRRDDEIKRDSQPISGGHIIRIFETSSGTNNTNEKKEVCCWNVHLTGVRCRNVNNSELREAVQVNHLGENAEHTQDQCLGRNDGTQNCQNKHDPVKPAIDTSRDRSVENARELVWVINEECTLTKVGDHETHKHK